jgi:hypothetical protein
MLIVRGMIISDGITKKRMRTKRTKAGGGGHKPLVNVRK